MIHFTAAIWSSKPPYLFRADDVINLSLPDFILDHFLVLICFAWLHYNLQSNTFKKCLPKLPTIYHFWIQFMDLKLLLMHINVSRFKNTLNITIRKEVRKNLFLKISTTFHKEKYHTISKKRLEKLHIV